MAIDLPTDIVADDNRYDAEAHARHHNAANKALTGVDEAAMALAAGSTVGGQQILDRPAADAAYVPAAAIIPAGSTVAEAQALIDGLGGQRGVVQFAWGNYTGLSANLDAKRAILRGAGVPGIGGGGGTQLEFSGAFGIFSSIEDNYGYEVRDMYVKGSAPADTTQLQNGQTLIDMTGQNYPRLWNVRVGHAETGVRLAKGATTECNYGTFYRLDGGYCHNGVLIDAGAGGLTNSHDFFGGRWNACKRGVHINGNSNNINLYGVTFECGTGNTGLLSKGSNVNTWGCRWETAGGTNMHVLAGAGPHFTHGDHWSSGFDIVDDNMPSVVWGIGSTQGSSPVMPATGFNLIKNGSFEWDSNGDGVADEWTESFSTAGTRVWSLDSTQAQEGSFCQKVVTGTGNNVRLYQPIKVTPNVWQTLRVRARVNLGDSNHIRAGVAQSGTEFLNVAMVPDDTMREYRLPFKPTTDTVFITFYFTGTVDRTAFMEGVTITPGLSAPPQFVPRPMVEAAPAADPGTATGTDAAVINNVVAALRSRGIVL